MVSSNTGLIGRNFYEILTFFDRIITLHAQLEIVIIIVIITLIDGGLSL